MLLCPVIGKLQHKRVVLASSSPRRREILSNAVSGPGPGSGGSGPADPGLVTRGLGIPGVVTRVSRMDPRVAGPGPRNWGCLSS